MMMSYLLLMTILTNMRKVSSPFQSKQHKTDKRIMQFAMESIVKNTHLVTFHKNEFYMKPRICMFTGKTPPYFHISCTFNLTEDIFHRSPHELKMNQCLFAKLRISMHSRK